MLPTPDTSHIPSSTYPPAEDSYLFLDALSSAEEIKYLTRSLRSSGGTPLAVEVGTGSGIILAFLTANAEILTGGSDILTLGIDLNTQACIAAERTTQKYCETRREQCQDRTGVSLGCVNGNLTDVLRLGEADLLLFNPPYVPSDHVPTFNGAPETSAFERESNLLALATDGGIDGMEVTERLLQSLSTVLSPRGVAYILFCKRNRPEDVIGRMNAWDAGAWNAKVIISSGRTGGLEQLSIIRIARALKP